MEEFIKFLGLMFLLFIILRFVIKFIYFLGSFPLGVIILIIIVIFIIKR